MREPSCRLGRVLLPRSRDRAARWVRTLREAGAEPVLVPLIDFEVSREPEALRQIPALLRGAERSLLTVTSVTTVRAFAQAGILEELAAAPRSCTVAAVGSASARAFEAEGVRVDLVPAGAMNAAGLVEELREDRAQGGVPGLAVLAQADLASDELRSGLADLGWEVRVIEAYRTVDAPADPGLRLDAALRGPREEADAELVSPVEARRVDWAAAVAMSPSTARRLAELFGDRLPPVVAIGPSTAAELERLGRPAAAVASEPSPEGVAEQLTEIQTRKDRP